MNLMTLWEKIQPEIKNKIGESSYEKWFSCLSIKIRNNNTLVVEAPDEFFKNWIRDHYLVFINQSLTQKFSNPFQIELEVNPNLLEQNIKRGAAVSSDKNPAKSVFIQDQNRFGINPRFTFDNFIVGPSNRFAHAACMAVAESPAKAYNPLFIYGGVGLGKTHLMQSITQKIHSANPNLKHCYISSERFTNELIDSIRNRSTSQFRQKYRNIDVLLIDDIHFIAGKESTQEEFFHTFNTLHDSRKQIIISSDRPPKEIANLEERLISRFAWGLITDIQPPDFETRVAILRKKMEHEPTRVPDDVIMFIAQEIKTNIRELEGALIRVVASSLLEERPISLQMAKAILKDVVKESTYLVNVQFIQSKVAEFFKVSLSDLKMKKRNKNIVLPRQVAMYIARKLTNLSLPEIGNSFGGKDHTTVLHACKKIDHAIQNDNLLKNTIEKIITTINNASDRNS